MAQLCVLLNIHISNVYYHVYYHVLEKCILKKLRL